MTPRTSDPRAHFPRPGQTALLPRCSVKTAQQPPKNRAKSAQRFQEKTAQISDTDFAVLAILLPYCEPQFSIFDAVDVDF